MSTRRLFLATLLSSCSRAQSGVRLKAKPVDNPAGDTRAGIIPLESDPRKIAVCGFSDGASYAIGLGISNGGLLGAVIAFSPGFVPPGVQRAGRPRILISHGRRDQILPFENTSGEMVPLLKQAGYSVTFREFDGPHTVPPEVARGAMEWFLK